MKQIYSFVFAALLLVPLLTKTMGNYDIDIFNDPDIESLVAQSTFSFKSTISPDDAVKLLLDLGIINLLEVDFFLRTNPLNERENLDLPFNLAHRYSCDHCHGFGVYLFYNEVSRMHFCCDTSIDSYLAISENQFLDRLEQTLELIRPLISTAFDFNVRDALGLFKDFTIQERQLGFMFNGYRKHGKWRTRAWIPFYYLERNYFVTPEEQKAIEEAFGRAEDQAQQNRFVEEFFIADKLGFGDTRVEWDRTFKKSQNMSMRLGAMATVPTAFAVAKGLKGSYFPNNFCRPVLDLATLVDQVAAIQDISETELGDFLLAVSRSLSAQLLETPMGNGGHFGIGPLMYSKTRLNTIIERPWTKRFLWRSRMSLEYLLPAHERRFFIQKNDLSGFISRNFDAEEVTPDQARDNLDFLEQTLTDRLFPYKFDALVYPGWIYRSTSKFIYEGCRWCFYLGTDFWFKSQEKIKNIRSPQTLNLNVDIATKCSAWQSKFIGGIVHKKKRGAREWTLSLNIDKTYVSGGIGEDFTFSFNVDVEF